MKGWYKDNYRHSLSARGIRTSFANSKYEMLINNGGITQEAWNKQLKKNIDYWERYKEKLKEEEGWGPWKEVGNIPVEEFKKPSGMTEEEYKWFINGGNKPKDRMVKPHWSEELTGMPGIEDISEEQYQDILKEAVELGHEIYGAKKDLDKIKSGSKQGVVESQPFIVLPQPQHEEQAPLFSRSDIEANRRVMEDQRDFDNLLALERMEQGEKDMRKMQSALRSQRVRSGDIEAAYE